MNRSDGELVRQCLAGEQAAFGQLIQRYQTVLLAHLSGRLGNRADAEDAAQEAFVRTFRSLGNLRKPESFFAFLMGVAGRVSLENQRAHARQRKIVDAAVVLASQIPDPPAQDDQELRRCLAALPEMCERIVLLRFYGGLSCNQIAEKLELPLGTVTKTLSRAYSTLRQSLTDTSGVTTTPKAR